MSFASRHLAGFACGILGAISAFGFPPYGYWPVLLICLVGFMALVQRAASVRSALWLGWLFGFGQFAVSLSWMAHAFSYQDAMPVWLGWFASPLIALVVAIFPAFAAGLAWRFGRHNSLTLTLLLAASWIVTEWLRAHIFTGFSWNPLGIAFVDGAGLAPVIGTFGLSALVILAGGGLWRATQKQWRSSAALLLLPAWSWLAGFAQIPEIDENPNLPRVRIVQPNIGQQDKYRPDYAITNFAKLSGLSGAPQKEPRLIFWPEAAIPDFLEEEEWARERLAKLMQPKDILLTGADSLQYGAGHKLIGAHNSLFILNGSGAINARYDKAHLVPFGEYLPLRALLEPMGLARLVPGDIDFFPGPGPRSYSLPGGVRVGIQICYEIIFPGEVVDAANRPDFIFNPSNDAWYGAWQPPQHLAQARLRAVEEGLPVIRSTPTGISAIIDADGKIVRQLPIGRPGYIDARLPAAHPPTPFARLGNLMPLAFAFSLVLIAIALQRRLR